nr:MetaGeneMark_Unknown Function [uncultured bacterium]
MDLYGGMMRRRSTLTEDFFAVKVHSLRAPGNDPIVLDTQPVAIAVIPTTQARPDPIDLVEAEWVGDAGTTRVMRAMFGPGTGHTLTAGTYKVWAKVDGGTWVIVEPAYQVDVI